VKKIFTNFLTKFVRIVFSRKFC